MATRKELAERQQAEWEKKSEWAKALDDVCLCTPKHMREREEVCRIIQEEVSKRIIMAENQRRGALWDRYRNK